MRHGGACRNTEMDGGGQLIRLGHGEREVDEFKSILFGCGRLYGVRGKLLHGARRVGWTSIYGMTYERAP